MRVRGGGSNRCQQQHIERWANGSKLEGPLHHTLHIPTIASTGLSPAQHIPLPPIPSLSTLQPLPTHLHNGTVSLGAPQCGRHIAGTLSLLKHERGAARLKHLSHKVAAVGTARGPEHRLIQRAPQRRCKLDRLLLRRCCCLCNCRRCCCRCCAGSTDSTTAIVAASCLELLPLLVEQCIVESLHQVRVGDVSAQELGLLCCGATVR